jgi:hypothetical protein
VIPLSLLPRKRRSVIPGIIIIIIIIIVVKSRYAKFAHALETIDVVERDPFDRDPLIPDECDE